MKKFLILCLVPFAACKKDGDKKDPPLIPLAVGNYWIYDEQRYNKDGSPDEQFYDTTRVTGNGTRADYFLMDEGWSQLYSTATEVKVYAPLENIDWVLYRKSDKINTIQVGYDSYGEKNVKIAHPGTYQVLGYNCIKGEQLVYELSGRLFDRFYDYVAPGIGIVRSDHYALNNTGSSTDTLFLRWRRDLVSFKVDN